MATPVHVYVVLGTSARAPITHSAMPPRFSCAARTPSASSRRRGDDPELAAFLRVEERELEAGGGN
ncbi:MAG: hypothetical protein ACRDPZ_09640 [Gaiellaceae bacterium]